MKKEIEENRIPKLIIKIEERPFTREEFLDSLASYSTLLYRIKQEVKQAS